MCGADNKDSLGLAACEAPEGVLWGCRWEPYHRMCGQVLQCRCSRFPLSPPKPATLFPGVMWLGDFGFRPRGKRLLEGRAL